VSVVLGGGGNPRIGEWKEATSGLHTDIAEKYENLFLLENPTKEKISKIGFGGYEVILN